MAGIDNPLLDELTQDFERLKKQKSRAHGSLEARILQNLCFVHNEQYVNVKGNSLELTQINRNEIYLMWNLIAPRMNKLLGRLSAVAPPFKAQPNKKSPKALAEAEVVDSLIRALDQKLDQPSRNWEILYWMMIGGVAFEHVPWVPNASMDLMPAKDEAGGLMFTHMPTQTEVPEAEKDQMVAQGAPEENFELKEVAEMVGEVGSEILGPLNVFVDNSVRSIAELAPDQRVYIAQIKTMGWVQENFGIELSPDDNFSIVSLGFNDAMQESGVGGTYLRDLIPLIQGSNDANDMPMVVVVTAYGPPSKTNPKGTFCVFSPGKELLYEGECPYEEIPIVDYHWRPVTTSFWTQDYVSALIPPQKFINKRLSQMAEQANSSVGSPILGGPGMSAEDVPTDKPGFVKNGLSETGAMLMARLAPPEFPQWFMDSIKQAIAMFNDIAGGADLFQEQKFPGQLRGPMAVPMLQEILDTEWGPLFNHLAERLGKVKQMRMNRVKQFYPAQRTLHYVSRDQKDEVLTFHANEVLRSDVNFNITIERGALLPELRALREARLIERLNGPLSILYLDERTGRLDKSKIAADLQFGDVGREGREAQYRKLGGEIVEMLWQGLQVPPVLPFYDHVAMMDELEAAMATTEYLRAAQATQQAFSQRWEEHRKFMIMEAQQQQQVMQQGAIHSAVAMATQQAAAQAAAQTVNATMDQTQAQKEMPTGQIVRNAQQQNPPKERSIHIKEKG